MKGKISLILIGIACIVGLFFPPLIGVLAGPMVAIIFILWVLDWMGII